MRKVKRTSKFGWIFGIIGAVLTALPGALLIEYYIEDSIRWHDPYSWESIAPLCRDWGVIIVVLSVPGIVGCFFKKRRIAAGVLMLTSGVLTLASGVLMLIEGKMLASAILRRIFSVLISDWERWWNLFPNLERWFLLLGPVLLLAAGIYALWEKSLPTLPSSRKATAAELKTRIQKEMDEACIRKAWRQLDRLIEADYPGRYAELQTAAQGYAKAVLAAGDKDRIRKSGKRRLRLAAGMLLDGKQFSRLLTHVIRIEGN